MSGYQYYYFEAVDKPLTPLQQQKLRAVSTRAQINSRRFVNEYHFGNLSASPENLLKKYFDIHLYYANWGTRIIMFKVPIKMVDFETVKQYETGETLRVTKNGSHVIFDITADSDDCEEWWEDSMKIDRYACFRDDLMAGDYRCLYIAWLAQHWPSNEERKLPPVPAGMKKLTGTLRSFAEFMYIDKNDLKNALNSLRSDESPALSLKNVKAWAATLSERDRQKILVDLLMEKQPVQAIQRELLNRFLKDQ